MEMKFFVNARKMTVAIICSVTFAALSVFLSIGHHWLTALLTLILCLIYAGTAIKNGQIIRLDDCGVSSRTLSGSLVMPWPEIHEIGVVGLRVIRGEGQKHCGSKNIYFSSVPLSDDELFELCLNWPPKKMLYTRFTYKRIAAIQRVWSRDIRMYNVGDLRF